MMNIPAAKALATMPETTHQTQTCSVKDPAYLFVKLQLYLITNNYPCLSV
jgi:hypothetical protein